eukprot:Blabericola_migrator_1__43@NODE_100_length_14362_cov_139_136341_g85_i1_p8_GENE_NODE_100_length_14362_cov_139_136341_g85_i1NODE_100_length_14362_cov_139_136341_g85_i1_p8_ORF_typecomplete_len269_score72_99_NODE_100_length_14362_cov_139_136341_g85_i12771083
MMVESTRDYPPGRVVMHLKAQAIRTQIAAMTDVSVQDLAGPHTQTLPFPFAGEPKPYDRFMIDSATNTFQYVGRSIYTDFMETVIGELNKMLTVNVLSEKPNGKSHMVAAGVVQVMKEGKAIVYLPRLYDFVMNPLDYLRAALLTCYCTQPEDCFFLMDCDTLDDMLEWCDSKDFILVCDQVESVEADGDNYALTVCQKETGDKLLHRLHQNRPLVKCYAAGSQAFIQRFKSLDQRSERDLELRSGFEINEKEMIEKLKGSVKGKLVL